MANIHHRKSQANVTADYDRSGTLKTSFSLNTGLGEAEKGVSS